MARVVLDTNVLLASRLSKSASSPAAECVQRWKRGDFALLFSEDTLLEYAEKLIELGIPRTMSVRLLSRIRALGELVYVAIFHLRHYPDDPDDIAFLLCAINGTASHLVTYDRHLLDLEPHYPEFAICQPLVFLEAMRAL